MADRRSVFTDARVIEASKRFVCAADEVWRLQRGSEADCVFFQKMVNGGKRITDRGSRQGIWVCAPSGVLLSHVNTRNVERVLECLDSGYATFETLPDDKKQLDPNVELSPEHRWEMSFPTDGLALERIGRELTRDGLAADPHRSWNRDYAWFSAGEIRDAIPTDAKPGEAFSIPLLALRLAQFHLVDNVRGQSLPFAKDEITRAELTATITARDGEIVSMTLEGQTSAIADGPWQLGDSLWTPKQTHPHGIECRLVGRAQWNAASGRFDAFELVAIGRRWGRTAMNGRGRDDAPGLVAFHMETTERNLAPTFVAIYDADWIRRPAIPTWRESPDECQLGGG